MKIFSIVGARPNFIKIAPLIREMKNYDDIESVLIHTGQHYSNEMSEIFFRDLNIPEPNYNLEVGSGDTPYQILEITKRLYKIFSKEKPDLAIVVGDTNSSLAGALAARKFHVCLSHIESGLRSFDMDMIEESNRILIDHISDFLFITEDSASKNLRKEGINPAKIFFVGNIMIDTLSQYKDKSLKHSLPKILNIKAGDYAVLTAHRPENIEQKIIFKGILEGICEVQKKIKIIWPIHPRSEKALRSFGFLKKIQEMKNLKLISSLGYIDMLCLISHSKFVLTDSGGLQEETTFLGIPCLTLRENTERPITVQIGTNKVIGLKKEDIIKNSFEIIGGAAKEGRIPVLWDGKTSKRIINILMNANS